MQFAFGSTVRTYALFYRNNIFGSVEKKVYLAHLIVQVGGVCVKKTLKRIAIKVVRPFGELFSVKGFLWRADVSALLNVVRRE